MHSQPGTPTRRTRTGRESNPTRFLKVEFIGMFLRLLEQANTHDAGIAPVHQMETLRAAIDGQFRRRKFQASGGDDPAVRKPDLVEKVTLVFRVVEEFARRVDVEGIMLLRCKV